MCSFKSIYFVIFILNLYETHAEISDKRLCADLQCNEPLSTAKTLLRYSSPDPRILSFAPNAEVTIYSKEAGSETSLWGATIKGKRGYIPKHLVREYKIYKKPTLLVDTELKQSSQVPKEPDQNIDPNSVKKSYEVVDGTTIYLNPQDVSPSTTESPVLSTVSPTDNITEQQTVTVDEPKEKIEAKAETKQESIVNSVLSSFSSLIDDDNDSEEIDAEDDDEDEEDEEDEDESIEEKEVPDEKTPEATPNIEQDINTLHNLPEGINISPYSLEIEQPLNGTIETSAKDESQEVPLDTIASPTDKVPEVDPVVEKTEEVLPQDENATFDPAASPLATNNEETPVAEPKESEEILSTPKIEPVVADTATESAVGSETIKEETKPIEIIDNIVDRLPENTEPSVTVTDPSIVPEEEQFPFVEDVTTPSSLEIEQEPTKTEELVMDPPKEPEESNNVEVESSTPSSEVTSEGTSESATLGAETVPESIPAPENLEGNKNSAEVNEINKNFVPLPPFNLFNPTQNVPVQEESKETVVEHKTPEESINDTDASDEQDVKDVGSEEAQDISNKVPDSSENEVTNAEEDQSNVNPVPDDFQTEPSPDETPESNLEQEIKVEDEIKNELKDEPQTDDSNNSGEIQEERPQETAEASTGMWSGLFSFFRGGSEETVPNPPDQESVVEITPEENVWVPQHTEEIANNDNSYCDITSESCNTSQQEPAANFDGIFDNITMKFSSDFFLLLVTTAGSVIVFLFVYMALDRHKKEAPLVARINKLEKELLVTLKEIELLQEKGSSGTQEIENIPNEIVEQLTQRLAEAQFSQASLEEKIVDLEKQLEVKAGLEEQIESLEKEMETSTEVGMELNRIISEMLDPTNGSDRLKENVEQLQRQLLEQKDTINSINETLRDKEAENRALRADLEKSKKVAMEFQSKVDEMVEKILKIEREKDKQQSSLQNEISVYQQKYNEAASREEILNNDNQIIRLQLTEAQRRADLKTKEYQTLKDSLDKLKPLKNNSEALKALLDSTSIRAEIQQLKSENASCVVQLQQEQAVKAGYEKKYQAAVEEMGSLREKYELADKQKLEVNSKLEVLNNYFKKRESELQEEIIRYKSIWDVKEGEATSTTERMKYLQEEIENYKAQNETLKQEIMSQEIDLKSQISVLEKKVHENWVTARQNDRKLEDARQEAAQLRNRLTLRERSINEDRTHNRLLSPVEQNGDLVLSPHQIDSPASPPLLYGARDHITKSPPLPGMPPFLPPPPGAPFMPPPLHGLPPFMPPPPSMFPGDHRPPPLGRMSSPPLNSRYSPDTSAFSPYDRNSPSPPYDSEYGASPPPIRGYSPYNSRDDRRDYKRPPHSRTNGRNAKGPVMSSGSDHSNDSLDKLNRKQSKKV